MTRLIQSIAMNTKEIIEKSTILDPNIRTFIAEFARKCGYCASFYGFVAISAALLHASGGLIRD
jgi:aerobic-type carbon monoxide dehydrogenase small subunit (CoxS/CutS family)